MTMFDFKRPINAAFVVLALFVFVMTASAKKDEKVERGMTKQQVSEIYGKPLTTSFDDAGECWEYVKTRGSLLSSYDVRITVFFDDEGKVVQYKEQVKEDCSDMQQVSRPAPPADDGVMPHYGGRRFAPLNDADFDMLLSMVKGSSFDSNKLNLVQVACLGCWFTCRQCASLISVFSFSDGKLKALSHMAPRLIDLQNANEIYRKFSFGSEKDKAAVIISKARR